MSHVLISLIFVQCSVNKMMFSLADNILENGPDDDFANVEKFYLWAIDITIPPYVMTFDLFQREIN